MIKIDFKMSKLFFFKRAAYFFAAFFLFLACNKSHKEYKIHSKNLETLYYLDDSVKQVEIGNEFFPRYEIKQIFKDTLFFGFRPSLMNERMDIIHLSNPEKSKSIYLKDKLKGKLSSFFVHNLDSILIIMNDTKQFAWIDIDGNVYSNFSFEKISNPYFDLLPFIQNKPIYFSGKVIFNYRHVGLLESSEYLKEPQMAIFDLTNNKLNQFGQASFLREYLNHKEVNTDFYSPNFIINNLGELIISYPFYPYLLIYDLNSLEIKKKVPLKSSKVQMMSPPTNKGIHDDGFKNAIYRSEIATFFDLNFHEDLNKYTILFMHPYQALDDKGKLKEWDKRNSSLLVLNHDFQIEREILFENGDLLMNAILGLSKGIFFAKHIFNNNEENKLHYSYFISLE